MDHSRNRDGAAAVRRDDALRRLRHLSAGVVALGATLTAVIGGLAASASSVAGTASTRAAPGDSVQLGGDGGQLQPPDQAPASGDSGGGASAVTGGS
ncbi:MAG TPA: hypothetical protein VGL20_17765 [Candidatus Dormibacteraeota bacterium]